VTTETNELELQNEEAVVEEQAELEPVAIAPTADEHHAAKLTAMREELSDLAVERAKLDEKRKVLKKRYDGLVEQLASDQVKGPEYLPLIDGPAAKSEEPEAWRELLVDSLLLPGHIEQKLLAADIVSLGQLSDKMDGDWWWETMPAGIGKAAAEKISDAFAAFWAKHPEYCNADGYPGPLDGEFPEAAPMKIRLLVDRPEDALSTGDVLETVGAEDDDGAVEVKIPATTVKAAYTTMLDAFGWEACDDSEQCVLDEETDA
jgi:hypothetical protein